MRNCALGATFFIILGLCGSNLISFPQDEVLNYTSDRMIKLPNVKGPLFTDMGLQNIRDALYSKVDMRVEELSIGATYCMLDLGYPLILVLIDGKLVEIQVNGQERDSKFGRWFNRRANLLPHYVTTYHSDQGEEKPSGPWRKVWAAPSSIWSVKLFVSAVKLNSYTST